jgi:beta-phosphoglucomutase-like phosphatase (HAD superfamily)
MGCWSVARAKPAPDLFLYAAQYLMTAPDRCLVIEVSPAGIDADLATDMTAIGFAGGSHCGPERGGLRRHGAGLATTLAGKTVAERDVSRIA